MYRAIALIMALLSAGNVFAEEQEMKAFLLGHTSGLSGNLTLLPYIDRSSDQELKKAYAQNLVLALNSIRSLSPRFSELGTIEITPLCDAVIMGIPFLERHADSNVLTSTVLEYLRSNKGEIVATFNKDPLNEYSPSQCGKILRQSLGQKPNQSFKADGVPPQP